MSGAEARALAKSPAFREAMTDLQAAANRATPGMGTRAGNLKGRSHFADLVQISFAHASKIPFGTMDKKIYNFVRHQARRWINDLMLL